MRKVIQHVRKVANRKRGSTELNSLCGSPVANVSPQEPHWQQGKHRKVLQCGRYLWLILYHSHCIYALQWLISCWIVSLSNSLAASTSLCTYDDQ